MNEIAVLGGIVGDKIIDIAFDQFKGMIISRYVNFRARNFFTGLFWSDGEELKRKVDDFSNNLNNEKFSETVFDFYRSACLSKSKTLGPLLLGLVASEIIALNNDPNQELQNLADFLQESLDDDIVAMNTFLVRDLNRERHANTVKEHLKEVVIEWSRESTVITGRDYELPASPMNLYDCIGKWASIAQRNDLIRVEVTEKVTAYDADSHFIDEPGRQKVVITELTVSRSLIQLREQIIKLQNAGLWPDR